MDALGPGDVTALAITFRLAAVSTVILLLLGTPLAWWLARTRWRYRSVVDAVVAMPLVLPPTVLGFYLMLSLGPFGFIGGTLEALGASHLAFTFSGLVVGSVIYSLPFVVQPLQNAFASLAEDALQAAATLRAGPLDRFVTVVIPLSARGFLTAGTLGFAHTIGEFGAVLMIGGSIPGRTQVASIAIYEHVEAGDYGSAHALALVLVSISFALLVLLYSVNRRFRALNL
jgi:molybdate transport system permease protein